MNEETNSINFQGIMSTWDLSPKKTVFLLDSSPREMKT